MTILIKILLHILPVVPFTMQKYYFFVASLLAVAILYIKTFRFREQLADIKNKHGEDNLHYKRTLKQARFWEKLTFLQPM